MASMNALRGVLIAGAVVAGVVAAVAGRWSVTALMVVAVAVHGAGTLWLRHRAGEPLLSGPRVPASAEGSAGEPGGE